MCGLVKAWKKGVSNFSGSGVSNMLSDTWDKLQENVGFALDPGAQHEYLKDRRDDYEEDATQPMLDMAVKLGEGLTPEQKFRNQKTAMVGQPVLRGRQTPPTSTIRTAGQTTTTPKNRKYGSSLLTGSIG